MFNIFSSILAVVLYVLDRIASQVPGAIFFKRIAKRLERDVFIFNYFVFLSVYI